MTLGAYFMTIYGSRCIMDDDSRSIIDYSRSIINYSMSTIDD
jgi:hypothetical protein